MNISIIIRLSWSQFWCLVQYSVHKRITVFNHTFLTDFSLTFSRQQGLPNWARMKFTPELFVLSRRHGASLLLRERIMNRYGRNSSSWPQCGLALHATSIHSTLQGKKNRRLKAVHGKSQEKEKDRKIRSLRTSWSQITMRKLFDCLYSVWNPVVGSQGRKTAYKVWRDD